VDTAFLSMFSFPLISGDPATVFNDPGSIVITRELARKMFNREDVVGKFVRFDNTDNLKVTGVLKDLPNNTLFNFEYLTSYAHPNIRIDSDWTDISIGTFVQLKPNASIQSANRHMKDVIIRNSGGRAKTTEFLYPVSKLRLYSNFENGKAIGGRIERVKTFTLIAILILLIACINFMNLSTARSERRAREVGVRKVAGAGRHSLVLQFLTESFVMALVAGVIAIIVVQVSLPAFNQLTEKQLFLDFSNPVFYLGALGFILLSGLLAGSYPAFYLSAFRPSAVLKGHFRKVHALVTPRKVLVVLQFTFAVALIICTLVIRQQVKYGLDRRTGYNGHDLAYVFIQGDIEKNYALIKNDLLNSGAATSVTKAQAPLTQNWSSAISMNWEGKDPNAQIQINRYIEDGDLVKTAGLQLVVGRDIDSKTYPTDSTACLISESAVKVMAFKNPIGQVIYDDPLNWHVVGVIKDFILESPYEPIKPFMVKGPQYGGSVLLIKLNGDRPQSDNIGKAAAIFKKYNAAYPFEYSFTDEDYFRKFSDEQLTGTLTSLFAILTIVISCLGLFGLAAYMAENRVKEIGIRKTLGASVHGIAMLLSSDFLKLVMISVLVASPLAWFAMNK
ncbi:MAG TPA: FtsX-like permease family protein, partial [Chitinophagaceae bacterium]